MGVLIKAILFANQANGDAGFKWKIDGTVLDATGNPTQLALQSVSDGIEYNDALFVIGSRKDSSNSNHSVAARFQSHKITPDYWPFDTILWDLFIFKNHLYISDHTGAAFVFNNKQWLPTDLKLKPESNVIYSDGDDIIACYRTFWTKQHWRTGKCYAVVRGWQVDASWRGEPYPKVCNEHLYVYETYPTKGEFIKIINLHDGKIISTTHIHKQPKQLCDQE